MKLNSIDGTMWTGSVLMGSSSDKFDVIFDNASDWLTLEGGQCTSCYGDTYDNSKSTFAEQVNTEISQRQYGATTMMGTEWKDKVCVTEQVCIEDFEYFQITK